MQFDEPKTLHNKKRTDALFQNVGSSYAKAHPKAILTPTASGKALCLCHTSLPQQCPQCRNAAALHPCNGDRVLLRRLYGTLHHFMGYGTGKQDHQIRRADLLFDRTGFFRKHLRSAAVLHADICILTAHALISADNYNTHQFHLTWFSDEADLPLSTVFLAAKHSLVIKNCTFHGSSVMLCTVGDLCFFKS